MTNWSKPPQIKLQRPARPIHKSRELNITHCQRDHVKSIYIARNPSRVPMHTPSGSGSIGPKTTPQYVYHYHGPRFPINDTLKGNWLPSCSLPRIAGLVTALLSGRVNTRVSLSDKL